MGCREHFGRSSYSRMLGSIVPCGHVWRMFFCASDELDRIRSEESSAVAPGLAGTYAAFGTRSSGSARVLQAPTACRRARSGGERGPPKEPRAPRDLGALRPRSPRSCPNCPPWWLPELPPSPRASARHAPELRLLAAGARRVVAPRRPELHNRYRFQNVAGS